jgi:hypothetical protein
LTASIAGQRFGYAFGVLIDRLNAPEAAARQNRSLQRASTPRRGIQTGRWNDNCSLGRRNEPSSQASEGNCRKRDEAAL